MEQVFNSSKASVRMPFTFY